MVQDVDDGPIPHLDFVISYSFLNLFSRFPMMQMACCRLSASLLKNLMVGYLKVTLLLIGWMSILASNSMSYSCSHLVLSSDLSEHFVQLEHCHKKYTYQ